MGHDYTLKDIPETLYALTKRSAEANFRSLQQEFLYRLQLTFDLEQAGATQLHKSWVEEGLASGPARPFSPGDFEQAVNRGLAKAKARQAQ